MAIPANATLVTVALRGAFTQVDFTGVDATIAPRYAYVKGDPTAFTTGGTNGGSAASPKAIAQTGGLSLPGPMVRKAVVSTSARRQVIDNNKCNACHDSLGIQPAFHGTTNPNGVDAAPVPNGGAYGAGPSTDGDQCNACHLPNRAGNTGWTAGSSQFVHGIHGASNRTNSYNWHGNATYNYGMLEYPAVLNNCEQCHLPGTYDFTATASANALPNLLWTTVAGSAPSWSATGVVTNTSNATYISTGFNAPYLATAPGAVSNGLTPPTYTVAIGNGYLGTTTTGSAPNQVTALVPYAAGAASLVSSPITTVCSSCHDSAAAIGHFKSTGGTFYEPRSTTSLVSPIPTSAKTEGCLTCHGAGALMDIKVVHKIDLLKK